MNNENNELLNNDVEINASEENIILAPPVELFDEAKEIAQTTVSEEKFPFMLQYDANQKEFLLSLLDMVGGIVEDDDEEGHTLSVKMNMTQLAFVKRLDCVERVRTDEGINPFLAEDVAEVEPATPLRNEVSPASASTMSLSGREVTEEATITTYSAVTDSTSSSCYSCPSNTAMESAKPITVERMNFGCICCPGAEQWFMFNVPETKQYTIYTTGSLDTVGTLYDCCENQIVEVDDHEPCGKINFRITQTLNANTTYYIKVIEAKLNTGSYYLIITSKILADYVNVSPQTITLEKGKTYELPITPDHTYLNLNGNKRIDGFSVSISPSNANEQKILWHSSDDDVINITYDWHNDQRYHTITANEIGSAILYASDWIGNGKAAVVNISVTSSQLEAILENIQNCDTTTIPSDKKDCCIAIARGMLESDYETSFVAGMLANIVHEGNIGQFESSKYVTNPSAKPDYLVYMDSQYAGTDYYLNNYSGKTIMDVNVQNVYSMLHSLKTTSNDTWIINGSRVGFGVGSIQWTFSRAYTLIQLYLEVNNNKSSISKEQAIEAEKLMIMRELNSSEYRSIVNTWRNKCNNIDSVSAANIAGADLCNSYLRPADSSQAQKRATRAEAIYTAMVS